MSLMAVTLQVPGPWRADDLATSVSNFCWRGSSMPTARLASG